MEQENGEAAPHQARRFVDGILQRMIFDGEQLTDLMEPLGFKLENAAGIRSRVPYMSIHGGLHDTSAACGR
jgi:hypothetical protein